jgi:gliding motility-associated-like protein
LQQQPNQPATLQWSPPNYLDQPDLPTPTFQSGESTTYTVRAQTASGCRVSAQVAVVVYDRLYIPTAFSPNGDGNNEQWRLINSETYPDCEVSVYDRWGTLVYRGTGPTAAWDGRYGQTVVDPGVYTYQVKPAPNEPSLSGTLTVIR